jgi:hemerythrin-like metal-binding protein
MWYSATKIGIAAIDMEHSNIDTMLSMILLNSVDSQLIGKLIEALIRHFQNEEEIIRKKGQAFPENHLAEHEKLKDALLIKKQLWEVGELDPLELAQEIKQCLISHVTEFDKLLGQQ